MSDEYLWDRSGEPEKDIARLETVMGRLRSRPEEPAFAAQPAIVALPRHRARVGWRWTALAAAAILLAVVGVTRWISLGGPQAWSVIRLQGSPLVGGTHIAQRARLGAGQWVETQAFDRVRIVTGSVGEVELEPRTRLRLLRATSGEHRFALQRGTLHAVIWAPPRRFLVETPSALATDLGCTYTLTVDSLGAGSLRVTSGWVAFQHGGRESFVPAGAICHTHPGRGPGTPRYDDAPAALGEALEQLDFAALPAEARAQALATVLSRARARDAFTLWHLILRVAPAERAQVVEALAARVAPPDEETRTGALSGDRAALDRWWNRLGLGDADWWRMWEGRWPEKA